MNNKNRLISGFISVAIVFFFIGGWYGKNNADLEYVVKNYPRGDAGVPEQWLIMQNFMGEWEKMMFIFGYSNDEYVCEHLLEIARIESPERIFRCEDAN